MANIGNYEILEQIAEGGFGRIFKARHVLLDELACIKQNINATPKDTQLLRQEAKLLWRFDEYHSIPSTREFLKIDKDNYALVLKYIEGKTIQDTVENKGRIHPEDVCWITERLLGALHYIHYYGVIHCDIKPENVFAEPKKRDIKLIDFSVSSVMPSELTMPIGYTEKYAAPEILQGKPPIPETDIYGAGIVMLYALGGDVNSKKFPKDTPEELKDYCNALLKYDPQQRPSWKRKNPLESLSDLRLKLFGRRHMH